MPLDPSELLVLSHRQIVSALASLAGISKKSSGGSLCDRATFCNALHFLRIVAPEHSAAEEEVVFSRLRSAISREQTDLRRLLDDLEEEHGCTDRVHREVDQLGESWLAAGGLSPAKTTRLIDLLDGLAQLYRRHIEVEETAIFPLLAGALTAAGVEELGRELARRPLVSGSRREDRRPKV